MSFDFDELRKSIRRPRATVRLCLRGDLVAARNRAARDFDKAIREQATLAGSNVAELRDALAELEAELVPYTYTFEFEAVSRAEFTQLEEAHPYNPDTGMPSADMVCAVVAASLVEPDLTLDQVRELLSELSDGQVNELEATAWAVNRETGTVPLSVSGSE